MRKILAPGKNRTLAIQTISSQLFAKLSNSTEQSVPFQRLTVIQLKRFLPFMESEGSIQHSEETAIEANLTQTTLYEPNSFCYSPIRA